MSYKIYLHAVVILLLSNQISAQAAESVHDITTIEHKDLSTTSAVPTQPVVKTTSSAAQHNTDAALTAHKDIVTQVAPVNPETTSSDRLSATKANVNTAASNTTTQTTTSTTLLDALKNTTAASIELNTRLTTDEGGEDWWYGDFNLTDEYDRLNYTYTMSSVAHKVTGIMNQFLTIIAMAVIIVSHIISLII